MLFLSLLQIDVLLFGKMEAVNPYLFSLEPSTYFVSYFERGYYHR